MKKALALLLICCLALAAPCALADPEDFQGRILPDFSVQTIDGGTFTLSESLKTHGLVLINLWATWCGPCRMEFPYMEQAWEQYGSVVDVIALSVEYDDTFDVLRNFADANGLKFSIGRDETDIFGSLGGSAIPTTLIVNQEQRIVAVEIGAKTSLSSFTDQFDALLKQYPPQLSKERCVLYFRDTNGNPIQGVTVGFCNGEYNPVETDRNGRVSFDGDPKEYHIHLLSVPGGYAAPWEQMQVWGEEFELTVTLYPAK